MSLKTSYIIWMVLIIISFLLLCGFAHEWKQIILLKDININQTRYLYEDDIIKQTGLIIGMPLYSIDMDSVRQILLTNPYISDVVINKQLSGVLDIKVLEREIKASIFVEKFYYLDNEARLLPKTKLKIIPNVPIISGIKLKKENYKSGYIINGEYILTALRILDTTRSIDDEFYSLISEINLNENRDFLFLTNDFAIPIILGKENYNEKILLLSSFWKQFVIENGSQNLKYVDARFKDQLVVKWKDNIHRNIL